MSEVQKLIERMNDLSWKADCPDLDKLILSLETAMQQLDKYGFTEAQKAIEQICGGAK